MSFRVSLDSMVQCYCKNKTIWFSISSNDLKKDTRNIFPSHMGLSLQGRVFPTAFSPLYHLSVV